MTAYEIIDKTRRKIALTRNELEFFVKGCMTGDICDYQASAWLMAVCLNSLTEDEIFSLTEIMRDSGDKMDLSGINGITVDKHSTGGVGDKTTIVIAPICAACGVYTAKMSGRGLGFTGGTIDKLQSISGFKTELDFDEFISVVNRAGLSIISQSGNLCPADKFFYALRDATATVESIPLICASVMSKKLAMGADALVLDVKAGSGALMKTNEDALELARLMKMTAQKAGVSCRTVISDMNSPLGNNIGNSLEIVEVIELLQGKVKGRLYELCIRLAAEMLCAAGKGDILKCTQMARQAIENGSAISHLASMIELQHGDPRIIEDLSLLPKARYIESLKAVRSGYISNINGAGVGMGALILGAGRQHKDDDIDPSAGIIMRTQQGDYVKKGDVILEMHSSRVMDFSAAAQKLSESIEISEEKPIKNSIIIE